MKLLHSADWHLDAPIQGRTPEQTAQLRQALLALPQKITDLAKAEHCDLMLLSGDLFDGTCTAESLSAVQRALAQANMPVFISPGNHDPLVSGCPWHREGWPENVHIFTGPLASVSLPELDCRIYGAGFQGPGSAPLLQDFTAEGNERYRICVVHGDPTQVSSPHNPITRAQVQASGLDYLALGHIHKGDSFRAGKTLCAWPGCPMGRGFDELGQKGVLIAELNDGCQTRFMPIDGPQFHWLKAQVTTDAVSAVSAALPGAQSDDFLRVELTGECESVDTQAILAAFPGFPNLELRDSTVLPIDLWANADDDSLEGVFFSALRDADAPEHIRQQAARICRQILLGQEVQL